MSKYLELFKGSFNDSINEKTKPENKPYIGYSLTEGKLAYTVVPAKEEPSLYEAVDLGLPSGLKWADRNVGATSPEDAGLYFQWGDTVGYTADQVGVDKVFNGDSYFDTIDGGSTVNKYNFDGGLTQLESVDDAATQIMGSDWRMPTIEEIKELISNTTPTFIDLQGNEFTQDEAQNNAISEGNLKGIRLTSKENSNSIFIPAAGFCHESLLRGLGTSGCLWSSGLYGSNSYGGNLLSFNSHGGLNGKVYSVRYDGHCVRGVQA